MKIRSVCVHAMKACRDGEVQLHSFLTSAVDESRWSTSRLGRFTPGKKPLIPIE
jgi:hypothetical protein